VSHALIERVYVNWTQHWDLERYIENYIRTHRLRQDEDVRAAILSCIAEFPLASPYTKSDLDFFLDANLLRRM
jgi:hypothetical protein